MMSNLLPTTQLPTQIKAIQTNINYYEEIERLFEGLPRHLKSKILYYFGNTDEILSILCDNGYTASVIEPIKINGDTISQYWNTLVRLFRITIDQYLIEKGLSFNTTTYVTDWNKYGGTLIKKDERKNYYTHEGFHYRLHLINGEIYLSLTSCPVLTWDGKNDIITEEAQAFHTYQRSYRYNKYNKNMIMKWVDILHNGNGISIPVPNDRNLEFGTSFENIEEKNNTGVKRGGTLDDFR
ncbi:MAG: hypothetical protein NTW30_05780 [Candidatus Aenigmarchaeota archaeon]|nr:hypothetical protein [Candidatus Aenigmarchaeota archaeon]